jgi:K+-sensing histidine kinase KdpD
LGAAFYLDLVLIITAGFLSTLILIIGFFIETSSPITLESGFLLLAHIIFLAVVTYFVYLFTLSYIEVLWQKKKIRRISQVNKELLINTTNQLRAPLPVIRDFIGYLLLGHAGDINQKQMKILALLRRNTEQLIEEAGTAVYFNQIKRHELYISKVRTDLTELLKSEVQKSLADAQSKGLRIELNAPRSLLVNLDQNKIMHVIDSLIENAIIFSNRRARLKIKAEKDRAGQFVSIDFHYINIDIPNFAPHEIVSSKKILLNDDISIQNLLIDTYVAEKIIEKHRGSLKVAKDSKNNSFIFSIVLPAE